MVDKIKKKIVTNFVLIRQLYKAKKLFSHIVTFPKGEGLVIIPCDPETIIGSRGDEAMICSVINEFRDRDLYSQIFIIARDKRASEYLSNIKIDDNISVLECWNRPYALAFIYKVIKEICPAEAVIIGADCMDGAYAPSLSLDLLLCYNLLKASGLKTLLTGFSYNFSPHPYINYTFGRFKKEPYNLRDIKSLERFEKKTGAKGKLVADTAFLLRPDSNMSLYPSLVEWINNRKKNHDKIIAFNFHPMLRSYSDVSEMEVDAQSVYENISIVMSEYKDVSILLLPHDDRPRVNDATMLNIVNSKLKQSGWDNRVCYLETVPRASQLKYIASLMDGVISSRMHLAIAALGSCVPVMVADYQGKFEGLFDLFSLPYNYILSATGFCSPIFVKKFRSFYTELDNLRYHIQSKVDDVMILAKKNFINM